MAFARQADHCDAMGSPLTARVLRLLAERMMPDGPVTSRVLGWQGDPGTGHDALALRLAGGLHALVLDRIDPVLHRAYANAHDLSDLTLWRALKDAMAQHPDMLMRWLDLPPQTNELRRSAVLVAAAHWLTERFALPLVLSELGASAGLNLLWDLYAIEAAGRRLGPASVEAVGAEIVLRPQWLGPLPPEAPVRVAARAGVDLNPLCPVADQLRILSYIWAGQQERMALTRAALKLAAKVRPPVARGDAADWLEMRLREQHRGALHLVFHTVAWQYFPPDTRTRCEAALARDGAQATAQAPLARLSMESDGTSGQGAAVSIRIWSDARPEPQEISLGRADFHGRWVDWRPRAL